MPEAKTGIGIVEDDARVRRAIARLLRSAPFAIETFESAEAFLCRPHREACTCLLLDLDLPGGQSGRELADTLTATQSHLPIIFLSAREPRATNTCPSRAGAWLTKPLEEQDRFAAIREALTQGRNASAERQSAAEPTDRRHWTPS